MNEGIVTIGRATAQKLRAKTVARLDSREPPHYAGSLMVSVMRVLMY